MFVHAFAFDPTYGYSQEQLLAIKPPLPAPGFVAFWQDTYAAALAVDPGPQLRQIDSARPEVEVFELTYRGLDGFEVGGWLTRPRDQQATRGVIVGHGYGGREAPDLALPGPPAVAIFPCARGFHRSATADLPNDAGKHVVHGIDKPQTYLHRFCVADLWSATSALLAVAPQVGGCVDYMGSSFGGGIGALALPWEPRWRRGFIGVPSFGNHPLRLSIPCVGSGEAVRLLSQQKPEIIDGVLPLFDAASAAQFCRIPVMAACALFDPAVPPPGQFSVYNALAGQKQLHIHPAAHFVYDGEAVDGAKLFRAQQTWFA